MTGGVTAVAEVAEHVPADTAAPAHRTRATRVVAWEIAWLLVALVLAADVRALYLRHETITYSDEGSYLELAGNVRDGRGFVSDWKWTHWDDKITHPEHNRQPALPVSLGMLERALPAGHERGAGQALVFAFGLALVVASWAYARLLFGPHAGAIAAMLVALVPRVAQYSAIVMTEIPFALAIVVLGLLLHPTRRPGAARLVAAGAVVGIAYLIRSNGAWLLLPLGIALAAGPRPRRRWQWALPLVAMLVVAAPWFVRNQREFGSPVYSAASQVYFVDSGAQLMTIRDAPPDFATYRLTHSFGDMALHAAGGARYTFVQWMRGHLWPVWALAIIGLWSLRRRQVYAWSAILTTFVGVLWLAPAWNVERYAYPVVPLGAVLAAGGVVHLAARGRRPRVLAGAALVAATLVLGAQNRVLLEPRDLRYEAVLRGITAAAAATPPGTIIGERYGFPWLGSREWLYRRPTVFVNLEIPLDVALARMRRLGVRYLFAPDGVNGAPKEKVVVSEFPVAARGDGWTLRAL